MARPPRRRKSRKPEAPQHDVAVVIPPVDDILVDNPLDGPLEEPMHDASATAGAAPPQDELAEVDAGWD
jgi:hypothetical protein